MRKRLLGPEYSGIFCDSPGKLNHIQLVKTLSKYLSGSQDRFYVS